MCYQVDDLLLGEPVLLELAHEALDLLELAAEQVREPLEDLYHLSLRDPVVQVEKEHDFLDLSIQVFGN
jgi:hypothetical protein